MKKELDNWFLIAYSNALSKEIEKVSRKLEKESIKQGSVQEPIGFEFITYIDLESEGGKLKANRRTATGILRAYFEKNNIADGEDFEILDYRKFLADEKEAYRRQYGIDIFHDYGKFSKYVKNKYLKRK